MNDTENKMTSTAEVIYLAEYLSEKRTKSAKTEQAQVQGQWEDNWGDSPGQEALLARDARDHAIRVAAIALYGEPRYDEPLSETWRRTLDRLKLTELPELDLTRALEPYVFDVLPTPDEAARLTQVFKDAPEWLLDFCALIIDQRWVGFELPDATNLPNVQRNGEYQGFYAWPELPPDTPAGGGPFEYLAFTNADILDLRQLHRKGDKNWNDKDRCRYQEIIDTVRCDLVLFDKNQPVRTG
jgi:hypothetical protein